MFVYTREAHPGERYPAHRNFADKLRHAKDMVERWSIQRPMLLDDFDGTLHRAYGLLPNMTYVVSQAGRILFKADWTDARIVRLVVEQLAHERAARREGKRLAPFRVEWAPNRVGDRAAFMEGLHLAGPRAVEEFIAATENTMGEPAARGMREWWEARRER